MQIEGKKGVVAMRNLIIGGIIFLVITLIWTFDLFHVNTRLTELMEKAPSKATDQMTENSDKKVFSSVGFGLLYITSDPQKAEIFVNDTPKGIAPIYLREVRAGNCRITARSRYHLDKTKEINIEKDTVNTVYLILEKGKGKIKVFTKPNHASIYLNSKKINKKTPLIISNISSGKHILKIRKKSYSDREVSVEVLPDRTSTVEVILEKAPTSGQLFVKTDPEEAKIRILNRVGGFQQGKRLPPGKYHLEVSAEGYETKQEWATLGADEKKYTEITLTAVTGSISVSGSPHGAKVFLDGKYVNKIPCKLDRVMRGPHGITVKKNGYRDRTKKINVHQGQVLVLSVDLKPGPFTNSIGMRFVYIEPGSFMMGSAMDDRGRETDERPHHVTLTNGFYMQTTEVTQRQWKAVMETNPSRFIGDDLPVENVSWNDVRKFVGKLNRKEKTMMYRLPTEAEWEYACRAESTTAFTNGDMRGSGYGHEQNLNAIGWYYENSSCETHPVAKKKPNAWGLFDMHGNVWEWCQDRYGPYPSGSVTDLAGPSQGKKRVFRGGGWFSIARQCRSANRCMGKPDDGIANLGFRLVRLVKVSP